MKVAAAFAGLLAVASASPQYVKTPAAPKNGNGINPFEGTEYYVNARFQKTVDSSIKQFEKAGEKNLVKASKVVRDISTFVWIDTIASIKEKLDVVLPDAAKKAKSSKKPVLLPLVVYNLPERDCSAKASAGELYVAQNGVAKYKKYVDDIASRLAKYQGKNIKFAISIEPDSLPNLVTNVDNPATPEVEGVPKCDAAGPYYKDLIAYTIKKLQFPDVTLYLDAAHGNWLGWNMKGAADIYTEVLKKAAPATIRGYTINVSNYNPVNGDPLEPRVQWNPAYDEAHFALEFGNLLKNNYSAPHQFVIDTARNGGWPIKEWTAGAQWCNIKGAGIGARPSAVNVLPNVDAFAWVKTPGESDGTSDSTAERFDETCAKEPALQPAPEAGAWFHEQFKMLLLNSKPAL
ncbi:hypothetical protein HK097_001151 [Rhizophlyctis rosea]|uniref:Glucanase n=1 Tax=Rhizophlyctis rosea TaxID=64517 RepID=A0AAD5SJ67_9FUNG|nr:hypothetical protein HK097_001151 [Rhizophlyctis rosea]